jgi:hypothetical protein
MEEVESSESQDFREAKPSKARYTKTSMKVFHD